MNLLHSALLMGLLVTAGGLESRAHHWSYSGATGPTHWSLLEREYGTCGKGKAQSPIDIKTAQTRQEALPQLDFEYRRAVLHIVNNGHTIQVDAPAGGTIKIGGHRYHLVQFHFHHPSEEAIDGKTSAMVAHLVHRDAEGHLAVVAVLLQPGAANPLLSTLWRKLPRVEGRESSAKGVTIDATGLLPAARGYYTFRGSLTTPPCTEGVRWFVLKSPVTMSAHQLVEFDELYRNNARPLQPLNGRAVLSSQ